MKICMFNFNNEVDAFEIHVEDDGRVSVPGTDGQVMAEYDSVQQLAEIYAQARDVKPENLKNWVLLENGNVYSFVLRAGTAGVSVADVEEQLEEVFNNLAGNFHALSIARAKEQIMADGTADLVDVLVHCTETDVAREVYDAMAVAITGEAPAEAPAEPEDTRTDLERYVDDMSEVPGALVFLASLVGLGADAEKADVVEGLQGSFALNNVGSLRAIYDNAIAEARRDGIGVITDADALTVITQAVAGTKDDAVKNRMVVAARMAGRDKVNVSVDIVGQTHIRHTAEMVALDELEGIDLFVRNNVPYIVRFSETIDAELEAEAAAQDQENEGITQPDRNHPDGSYENDYIDGDYEDDEYDEEDEGDEE